MRLLVFSLAILASSASTARAQTTAWADKLFGGTTHHDFGVQARGAQLKYKFRMTNIYKVPLDITEVRVTCGCVTADATPKVLQPNETGWLNINMDASRFTGHKSITIFVTVGPEYISTATLTVSATTRTDVVFNPGEIDFGLVTHGQTPSKSIDVEYAGSFDWRVTEIVKTTTAPFELKVEELASSGPQIRGYRIVATLKADAAATKFREEVILKTNDPASPVLGFTVGGNIQASLSVTPSVLSLAGVAVGVTETRRVIVRGSRPFRIVRVDGQGDGVSVQLPTQEAATHIVEIRYQPAKAGDVRRDLVLRTDLGNEAVNVTVEGSAK